LSFLIDDGFLLSPELPNVSWFETKDEDAGVAEATKSERVENDPEKKGVKYHEVFRRKHDRALLHGMSCRCCESYYKATRRANASIREEGDSKGDALDYSVLSSPLMDLRQGLQAPSAISRHRYLYPPPNTPPGFWDIGFTPTE
jgi:hypothetical protein